MRDNKGSDGCRSPHGERGLKLIVPPCLTCAARVALLMESWIEMSVRMVFGLRIGSLSSWRAWIEIVPCPASGRVGPGRSPHGERGLKLRCSQTAELLESCRSPHGERGLKFDQAHVAGGIAGRSPHGERGLKLIVQPCLACPMRGRSPHGERGLKSRGIGLILYDAFCRSPHGERGLKSRVGPNPTRWHRSLSSWRAWIEIGCTTRST